MFLLEKLWLPGNYRETVPSWRELYCWTDGDPGTVLAPTHSASERGGQLERRAWVGRGGAHMEQGCITVGLVCEDTQCRHEAAGGGEWLYPRPPNGPLPEAGQKSSVCQPSQMERLQKLVEHCKRGNDFLPVPERPFGSPPQREGRALGLASSKNWACFQH